LEYAKKIASDVRALTIVTSPEMQERILRRWNRFPDITQDIQLVTIQYDFRDILRPLVDYIERVNKEEFPDLITTVVVPQFISDIGIANWLHTQTAKKLHSRLQEHKDIVIIDVPFHIDSQL